MPDMTKYPNGVIIWRIVFDDFGNALSVTDIHYPNPRYFSRVVQHYWR